MPVSPAVAAGEGASVDQAARRKAQVIAVCSGKGGVGKTSLATNLSIAFARSGKRVCIFDADVSLANVNILLGLTPTRTLVDYISGEAPIGDILVDAPESVKIVPGGGGVDAFVQLDAPQQERLLDGLRLLESSFDCLVVDTAAGISESQLQLIQAAPFVLVAITEEPTSLTDAFSLLKVLSRRDFTRPVLVVVNMAANATRAQAAFRRFSDAVVRYLKLKIHYLGYVVRDRAVIESVQQQSPFVISQADSVASRCIAVIARRLLRLMDTTGRTEGSFSAYFDGLKHADEGGEPQPSQAGLLSDLDDCLARMNAVEADALLQAILTRWPPGAAAHAAPSASQEPARPTSVAPSGDATDDQAGLRAALRIAAMIGH